METSPPIPVRIEWADSQGRVTASWLTAHFNFLGIIFSHSAQSQVRSRSAQQSPPSSGVKVRVGRDASQTGPSLADGNGLEQAGNLFEDPVHADVGIDDGVNFVMVRAGMHHQDFGSLVRLLDHVRQVMAVFLGHSGAQDDEVEGIAGKRFLDGLAAERGSDVMADFGHFGGLSGKCVLIGLAVENLDIGLARGFLTSCGQGPSSNSEEA